MKEKWWTSWSTRLIGEFVRDQPLSYNLTTMNKPERELGRIEVAPSLTSDQQRNLEEYASRLDSDTKGGELIDVLKRSESKGLLYEMGELIGAADSTLTFEDLDLLADDPRLENIISSIKKITWQMGQNRQMAERLIRSINQLKNSAQKPPASSAGEESREAA